MSRCAWSPVVLLTAVLCFGCGKSQQPPAQVATQPVAPTAGGGKSYQPPAEGATKVSISNVRLVPFVSRANGQQLQMVLCDITNHNDFPIESVWVTMTAEFGSTTQTYEEIVYVAADHGGQLIRPGATYSEQGDEGEVLVDVTLYGQVSRVTVTPTRAYAEGQWEDEQANR